MTKILIDEAVVRQVLDSYDRGDHDFCDYIEALRQALEQPAPAQYKGDKITLPKNPNDPLIIQKGGA